MRATWARADRRVFAVARSISTALRRDIDGVTQRSRWQEKAVEQEKIFGPFFAMMFLTIAVWIYMYVRRITFINLTKLSAEELAVPGALARHSPPAVSNPSDNLKNLFEVPVLFYALVLYLYTTKHVDLAYVDAGWIFVVFRVLHSTVHCTFNRVILRFYLYLFSALSVWFIMIRAAIAWTTG